MGRVLLHRDRAKLWLRVTQVAAVVLLAGSVTALMRVDLRPPTLPEPGDERPGGLGGLGGDGPGTDGVQTPPAGQDEPLAAGIDIEGIAYRLNLTVVRAPDAGGVEEPRDEPPPEVAEVDGWSFLGSIIEPTRRMALVKVNGVQRILAEGRTIQVNGEDVTLVRVGAGAIVIEDATGRKRITRASRTGSVLSERTEPEGASKGSGVKTAGSGPRTIPTDPDERARYLADRRDEARKRREAQRLGARPITSEQEARPISPGRSQGPNR